MLKELKQLTAAVAISAGAIVGFFALYQFAAPLAVASQTCTQLVGEGVFCD
jgi:hypothetical protein